MKTLFTLILILQILASCTFTPKENFTEDHKSESYETFLIQGYVLEEDTKLPPKGIFSINYVNKWENSNGHKGDNKKVYVNSQGYYSAIVDKNDTLKLVFMDLIYKNQQPNYTLTNFNSHQRVDFLIKRDSTIYNLYTTKDPSSKTRLDMLLSQKVDDDLIVLTGKVSENGKPLKNITVGVIGPNNTERTVNHHLTDKYGQFSLKVPRKSWIKINPRNPEKNLDFIMMNDTVINVNF